LLSHGGTAIGRPRLPVTLVAPTQTNSLTVTWAQRSSEHDPEKNYVFLTIVAADVPESDLKLDLQPTKLSFKGTSTSKKVTYAIDLDFFAEIDPKESKTLHSGRDVTLVLRKKELKEEFWPRLLKDKAKVHFLKTNFDKVSQLLNPSLCPQLLGG
jgi:hypothetical protein